MSIWDNQDLLEELEKRRGYLRARGRRLTFDCLNLKCRDERAYCSRGYCLRISGDGGLTLMTVLRGVTSSVCKNCKEFNTGEVL